MVDDEMTRVQDETGAAQPHGGMDRRSALRLLGAAALLGPGLAACSSGGAQRRSALPNPTWPESGPDSGPAARGAVGRRYSGRTYTPARPTPGAGGLDRLPTGVIQRSRWAGGEPVPALMDRQQPLNKITVHHDGMNAFTSTREGDAAARIEAIRRAHRANHWGDIGYHYAIDPAGRVWQARPLSWQGAHVGNQNHGNIGVCVLGNYEVQQPNSRQVEALESFIARLMRTHDIDVSRIYTHRELAATACPGRNLQPRLVAMRSSRGVLAAVV
jgi:hypothetical protein